MSNGQKTLLGCSILSYLLVLYSFFRFDLWLILIFFIMHSLVLLSLAFLFWKSNLEDNDLIELQAKYKKSAIENEKRADELNDKLEIQTRLTTSKDKELSDANARIGELELEISRLQDTQMERALEVQTMIADRDADRLRIHQPGQDGGDCKRHRDQSGTGKLYGAVYSSGL